MEWISNLEMTRREGRLTLSSHVASLTFCHPWLSGWIYIGFVVGQQCYQVIGFKVKNVKMLYYNDRVQE